MAFKKLVGDLAQTSVGSNIIFTGTTTAGSPNVTAVSSIAGWPAASLPVPITGTGIPAGTNILSASGTTVVLSANATAAGTVTLTAETEQQVVGLMEWSIDVSLKTPDATTTDDAAWESALPSSKSWTATAKYCYYDGEPSQQANILATINSPGVVTKWNFFYDAVNSDQAFTGYAFISSIKLGAGSGKVIGLDVTLKGSGPLTQTNQTAPVVNALTNTGLQAEV